MKYSKYSECKYKIAAYCHFFKMWNIWYIAVETNAKNFWSKKWNGGKFTKTQYYAIQISVHIIWVIAIFYADTKTRNKFVGFFNDIPYTKEGLLLNLLSLITALPSHYFILFTYSITSTVLINLHEHQHGYLWFEEIISPAVQWAYFYR